MGVSKEASANHHRLILCYLPEWLPNSSANSVLTAVIRNVRLGTVFSDSKFASCAFFDRLPVYYFDLCKNSTKIMIVNAYL
jgi:hypothetical protein